MTKVSYTISVPVPVLGVVGTMNSEWSSKARLRVMVISTWKRFKTGPKEPRFGRKY